MCVLTLKTSHRPNGKLTFCSLLAGRWCRSLWRHSDHLIVHHQWEFSFLCARSSSKVPNAPMGTLLTFLPSHACKLHIAPMGDSCLARCLQGGGVVVAFGTVSIVNSHVYSNQATFVRAYAPNPRCPLVVKRYSCQNLAPKLPLGPRAPCAGAQHLCR